MRTRTVTEIREAVRAVVENVERRVEETTCWPNVLTESERDSFVESAVGEVLRVLRVEEGLDTTEGA